MFYQLYKQEVEARIAKRWQALWVLRRGERWKRVKEMGGSRKPIQQGVKAWEGAGAWYGAMRLFPRRRRWERGGCGGYIKPSYSPELNPAERVFEAVRRWVGGRRYERIEAKKAAVEAVPRRLEAEAKVSSLVEWRHICQASNALPS